MAKPRGTRHTTLTETAADVVSVLTSLPHIKMIAPGIINTGARSGGGGRFITVVYTKAGFELIITGQSVQKVAVHVEEHDVAGVIKGLKSSKRLTEFVFKERSRKPEM